MKSYFYLNLSHKTSVLLHSIVTITFLFFIRKSLEHGIFYLRIGHRGLPENGLLLNRTRFMTDIIYFSIIFSLSLS